MPMGAAQVLRAIAERLVQFAQGDFRATGPPQVLQVLTDEITVIADEAVASVCAGVQPKPPSLAAKQRLLAWVVADARGATVALEKPLALTVSASGSRGRRRRCAPTSPPLPLRPLQPATQRALRPSARLPSPSSWQ